MDGYNWGKTAVNPHPWKSFSKIFEPTYESLTTKVAPKKPILLGEMASGTAGGHKGAWIRQMFADPSDQISAGSRPRLVRLDRSRDRLADRDFARGDKGLFHRDPQGDLRREPLRGAGRKPDPAPAALIPRRCCPVPISKHDPRSEPKRS